MPRVTKAVIPAAGWGTRFLPATKAQPKEMLPIVDKPAIQYIVEEAVASGIEDILIITGKNKRAIEDHFDRSPELEALLNEKGQEDLLRVVRFIPELGDIHYIRQKEQKGLGHAIWCARKFIGDEAFAVLLGDDIIDSEVACLAQMLEVYQRVNSTVVAVMEVEPREVSRYGIVEVKGNPSGASGEVLEVSDLVEKPSPEEAPSNLAVIGRYIIHPAIFPLLENQEAGSGGEIQLTDGLRALLKQEKVYAYRFAGRRFDVGDKIGFLQATVCLALQRREIGEEFADFLAEVLAGIYRRVG